MNSTDHRLAWMLPSDLRLDARAGFLASRSELLLGWTRAIEQQSVDIIMVDE